MFNNNININNNSNNDNKHNNKNEFMSADEGTASPARIAQTVAWGIPGASRQHLRNLLEQRRVAGALRIGLGIALGARWAQGGLQHRCPFWKMDWFPG